MSKIGIFTPTYHRFESTKRCLESLIKNIDSNTEHEISLFIGDNNSPKEMVDWLKSIAGGNVRLFLNPKNIGKAKIVNLMWNKLKDEGKEFDVFCSLDSDMVVHEDHQDWLNRCVDVVLNIDNDIGMPVGLVSTKQLEGNCHIKAHLTKKAKWKDNDIIYGNFSGVAGGCIFLKSSIWQEVVNKHGGYRVFGVYGADDAYLMLHIQKDMKKLCVVLDSAPLIHPKCSNEGYSLWKLDACHNLNKYKKGYFDE